MASVQGNAVYKKKDGIIAVSDDHTRVTWTPVAGGSPVTLATANITSELSRGVLAFKSLRNN